MKKDEVLKKHKEIKIVLVSLLGVSNSGGVERVTYYLKDILESHFNNVKLITRGKISFGKLCNFIWPFLISIRLFFMRNKIVISNSWNCFLYPSDFSIHHGTMKGTRLYSKGSRTSLIISLMEKISAKKALKILAVSENCKEELVNYYKIDSKKIEVLNNFVDEKIFFPARNSLISEQSSSKNIKNINILFSGALIERKGLSKLIEFSDFIENYSSDYCLNLLIASNTKSEYKHFINKNHTQLFSGLDINKMPDFYKRGDILIFPTLYEGFSMSSLEALASGLCLLGTNFAVTKELEEFDFCRLSDFSSPEETALSCIVLYEKFKNSKEEIASRTIQKFGRVVYEKKLLEYVKGALREKGYKNE